MCVCVCALCVHVCERQRKPGSGSNLEPPFLWHLWQMARPFEEQSTAIDIKLPALKTEGPAQPHLFTVSPRAAWTACPVTNAALAPPLIHNVGQCLPVKSITSHSGAVGDSVISTLIPPKSWGRLQRHALQRRITVYSPSFVCLFDACNWFQHINFLCLSVWTGGIESVNKRAGWWHKHESGDSSSRRCFGFHNLTDKANIPKTEVKYRSDATNMWQDTTIWSKTWRPVTCNHNITE